MAEIMLPLKKAAKKLKDNERLQKLLNQAGQKAQQNRERLEAVWADFQTLLDMLKAYVKREYTVIPWRTLLKLVAAVIYFVNPFDLVPDFLPAIGLVDDISVIAFVVQSLKNDIDNYSSWRDQNKKPETLATAQLR